jgi:hypothetical protein
MTEKNLHEIAPEGAWFKSSYSGNGNNCVEVANLGIIGQVGVRDSKDKQRPALTVPTDAWSAFVGMVRATEQ